MWKTIKKAAKWVWGKLTACFTWARKKLSRDEALHEAANPRENALSSDRQPAVVTPRLSFDNVSQEAAPQSRSFWTRLSQGLQWGFNLSTTDTYLQQCSAPNLAKMRHFISTTMNNPSPNNFTVLFALKRELEASYQSYKKRYESTQWRGATPAKLDEIHGKLDAYYKTGLDKLSRPFEKKGLAAYLESQFELFKAHPSSNNSAKLSKTISELIEQIDTLYKEDLPFYHDHLCLVLREILTEKRVALLGLPSDQSVINEMIHWLSEAEKKLLQKRAPKKVSASAKAFSTQDLDQLKVLNNALQTKIEKICADGALSFQDKAQAIYALKMEWHTEAASVERTWRAHPWDESHRETVEWKNQVLRDLAGWRASDALDKKIAVALPAATEWIEKQSQLVVAYEIDYIPALRENHFFAYVFYCSFFKLDWNQPLKARDLKRVCDQLSLICHPDKAPTYLSADINKVMTAFFNSAFNRIKMFSENLIKLLEKQDSLRQFGKSCSLWEINKYVTAGQREHQYLLEERIMSEDMKKLEEETAKINEETAKINEETAKINEETAELLRQSAEEIAAREASDAARKVLEKENMMLRQMIRELELEQEATLFQPSPWQDSKYFSGLHRRGFFRLPPAVFPQTTPVRALSAGDDDTKLLEQETTFSLC